MKWFLITLAIGLAASDKLDHTYLPPAGAQFAGGILGNQDAPLEPPHHTHPGSGQIIPGHEQHYPSLGINGDSLNFGDKIPKVPFNLNLENLPTTTTSYAFSQTTTYPPTEGFNPANLPINPVTGLPILLDQGNVPYGPTQGQQNIPQLPSQKPVYGANVQPGVASQGSNIVNFDQPGFNQLTNQISGQHPGQNVVNPGGVQIPGSANQLPVQNQGQLPIGQGVVQSFPPTGPTSQSFNQYPAQNLGNNGGVVSIPGGNQGFVQYPGQSTKQGLVPSTVSPINPQSAINQYGTNYDGSQGPLTQGTYTGQPINVGEPQPTQTSYQNQGPFNTGGVPQYSTENPNISGPRAPGSTPSYYNGITSTTPFPTIPSSTTGYSTVRPVYRPERPQAEADRNAVILNYENVRTPNGYSYSFDTSNGIHADESGIVDNGTKAQGSYSYIGDDGKLYSVIYTADENGFQPRGDHLPTPPPIPEAIQRVIEQAAKDKAAGIVDDGSYDETKYGDDKYQGISKHRRPLNQGQKATPDVNAANGSLLKPITGIKDEEYDEGLSQNEFNNNIPVNGGNRGYNNNLTVKPPSNQIIAANNIGDQGIRRVSENTNAPNRGYDENGRSVEGQGMSDQSNNYGQKKQETEVGNTISNGNSLPFDEVNGENKGLTVKNQGSSRHRPTSNVGKGNSATKYPGANVDVTTTEYPNTEIDGFDNDSQEMISGKPNSSTLDYDYVTGAPIAAGKKQLMRKRIKGNRRPGLNKQNEPQKLPGRNDIQGNTKTTSISDYIDNATKQPTSNLQATHQDNNGYHYQQPSSQFEQNTFPTRFRTQGMSTTLKPDQRNTEYVEGTTRKPFITPNVYEQNEKDSPSTTRKPFMTTGVTSPSENAYTDYNDDDYATDQDIDDERISSTKMPFEKSGITSQPYETTRKGSRPQYALNNQKTGTSQKETLRPGQKTGNTDSVAPGYTYGPTTSTLSHNSRFGTTEAPQNTNLSDRRPSSPNFDSTTAVGRPVTQSSLDQTAPNYKYQSTGPNSKYFDSNVVSGYPTSGLVGSTSGNPAVSTPQNYYSSTFRPSQGYSTTLSPPTSGYQPGSGVQFPGGPTGSPVSTQDSTFHTGYHYGPPKPGNPFGPDAGFFTPADNSRVSPTLPTGTYQTTYQGPGGFPSTTLGPIGGRQDTFISYQQGSITQNTAPIGDHQGNFHNQPSSPGYSSTIGSSTPGSVTYDYPGSPSSYKGTTGSEYGPSRPSYSTTNSPSTIGTTPRPYGPTTPTIPSQGSTTYRPGFQNIEEEFVGGPVDGFGRPIPTNQGSNTGLTYPTQGPRSPSSYKDTTSSEYGPSRPSYSTTNSPSTIGTTPRPYGPTTPTIPPQGSTTYRPGFQNTEEVFVGGPEDGFGRPIPSNQGSNTGLTYPTQGPIGSNNGQYFGGNQPSTKYPGDQSRIIGEDFSGPKQPQRFDAKTGYHYK